MTDDRVSVTIADGVADVRMVRADKRNAIDAAMFSALADAGERLKTEKGVRAVVLSGEGASFCAGLDFDSFRRMAGSGAGDGQARAETPERPPELPEGAVTSGIGQQACWVWQEVPVPVVAAVHGHAYGGGIQLALGADLRIVHPDTKLSLREVYWGLVPDMTGTLTLSQLVRADILKDLLLTARVFDGREAHAIGVATRLADDPYEAAHELARGFAASSPDAIRAGKALINGLLHEGAAGQFAAERAAIRSVSGKPNQVETVKANFENRPPVYQD